MEDYVKTAYGQLENFIIIGLTGRCRSGCSEVAKYLSNTDEFKLSTIKEHSNVLCNQIDFNTMKKFADENQKNMFPFDVINVRDILTTFIMDNYSPFFSILEKAYSGKFIKEEFEKKFAEKFNNEKFDVICDQSKKMWEEINKNVYTYIENGMVRDDYEFLIKKTSNVSEFIRTFLKNIESDAFTLTYQHIGNIVRKYGQILDDYKNGRADPKYIHSIIERINFLIKIMRRRDWICDTAHVLPVKKNNLHLVINSIKNVYEAYYMQARYGSFYLMGITVDDNERNNRAKTNLDEKKLKIIDFREQLSTAMKEYNKGKNEKNLFSEYLNNEEDIYAAFLLEAYLDGANKFYLQDVDYCLQNSDILINNSGSQEDLRRILLRYVSLMFHPGLVPPTIDEHNMQIAQTAKLNSGCISRQVGAVVCDKNGNILSVGWNDPSAHEENECFSCVRRNVEDLINKNYSNAYSSYELNNIEFRKCLAQKLYSVLDGKAKSKAANLVGNPERLHELYEIFKDNTKSRLKGLPSSYCFKDLYYAVTKEKNQVHTRAQHGEEKALECCNKSQTTGGTLYSTSSSCELCAKKALSYNIKRLVYIEPYRGITNEHILGHKSKDDKLQVNIELFTGATQRAYYKLYSTVFPLKDELALRGVKIK
jgi:deoxycytidylate deaminase